ncbi:hypothetical protein OSB04_019269 [Centaurea solstitialis]|uniref:Uncharacterized protein n=1 Tax=Centaurea solstitialis TaxID=347529 RepID=A0AA38WFQ8_9ASTR|nr:hypothetical protein OSB04_019269 [Centaurea solstitialis]
MMGELNFFVGIQVKQSPDGIFIIQSKYIKDMLKKFQMTNCSPIKAPMQTRNLLGPDLDGKSVDQKIYRSIIGSLLYLTATRPDIMFSTCFCARFQANPIESHLKVVKRILRYLKGTQDLSLWYPKDSSFELISFTDSDYGGCKLDRKSTSGSCQFLGDKLVSWTSKKQNCVSTSTAEAKYVAAASCCSQVLWMKTQLLDYGYKLKKVPIYCDSESAIAITSNPVQHSKTKHIDIRYHFIKDDVEKGNIEMFFVNTDFQLDDLFTKPLDEKRFNFLPSLDNFVNVDAKANASMDEVHEDENPIDINVDDDNVINDAIDIDDNAKINDIVDDTIDRDDKANDVDDNAKDAADIDDAFRHANGQLTNEGLRDWYLGTRLKEHETSAKHVMNVQSWYDLRLRLQKNETVDKVAQS